MKELFPEDRGGGGHLSGSSDKHLTAARELFGHSRHGVPPKELVELVKELRGRGTFSDFHYVGKVVRVDGTHVHAATANKVGPNRVVERVAFTVPAENSSKPRGGFFSEFRRGRREDI